MKLKNKRTGEMGDLIIDKDLLVVRTGTAWLHYASLVELNEEWEDYEEPKGSALDLMILTLINFIENEPDEDKVDLEDCNQMLEKLKAWKRLKDKGLYFVCDAVKEGEYEHNFVLRPVMPKDKRCVPMDVAKEIYNDIKLIFERNIKEVKNEINN